MKILNGMTFFFQCVTACFSLQMCDNHAKCVILGRSKVCIFCPGNNCSIATNFSVSCLFHYICKPDLVFRAFIIPEFFTIIRLYIKSHDTKNFAVSFRFEVYSRKKSMLLILLVLNDLL